MVRKRQIFRNNTVWQRQIFEDMTIGERIKKF